MLGSSLTTVLQGAAALEIVVQAHVSKGLPAFITVGLPDSAVKESRVRIEAAMKSTAITLPSRRVLVNLAPASIKKEGSGLDLAIAVATLVGMEVLSEEAVRGLQFVAELGLDGSLCGVRGLVVHARHARARGLRGIVVASSAAAEAALVPGLEVLHAATLGELVVALKGLRPLARQETTAWPLDAAQEARCFSEVRGQAQAKRALLVAAAGGHHVLLNGAAGVGKTMLCERFAGLLPSLSEQEALDTLAIHSLVGQARPSSRPPLRAPHHTASTAAIVGGGSNPRPGEISLAHNGVLFLDELGEFRAETLNALRQPLESGVVSVARSHASVSFAAAFQLLAATNPCPCGNRFHPSKRCECSTQALDRYRLRLQGPLTDRFDIAIGMFQPAARDASAGEPTVTLRERVAAAREFAATRGQRGLNRTLSGEALRQFTRLDAASARLIDDAQHALSLSGRAVDRVLRVARSIADCDARLTLGVDDVAEALSYRPQLLDRRSHGGDAGSEPAQRVGAA